MGRAIDVVDLRVVYRSEERNEETVALGGVSLRIAANEFVCIVGRSGCGKTTLLNGMAGNIKATSGAIMIDGVPVAGPGRDRAMVFQQASLFPWQTTLRNVTYGLELQGVGRSAADARAQQLLDVVGLSGYERFFPAQLSGGMQQRVNLARALAVDPEILLLDEPFAALDAQTREFMQVELTRVWQRFSKTAVFVTHDIGEAVFLADRVIVLSSRPGVVKADIKIDLPRPRTLNLKRTPEFLRLEDQVWSQLAESATELAEGIGSGPERAAAPDGGGLSRPAAASSAAALSRLGGAPPARVTQSRRRSGTAGRMGRFALGLLSVVCVIAFWQLSADLGWVNKIFSSSPADIFRAAVRLAPDRTFWRDIQTSAKEFAFGFALAVVLGIAIGILIGWYRTFAALLNPFVSGLYSTPRIALAPLLIIWLGIDSASKVALVTLSAIFPILINTATGIRTTDRHLVRVARSFGAGDWALFRTVAVPASVPFIVSGLRLGSGLGIIGVVVAELIAGTSGIGHRMMLAGQTFQTAEMFVCLLMFTSAGIALSAIFTRLEAYFDRWRSSSH
jgi:NitT/TauT family transport system ATP-binding protein